MTLQSIRANDSFARQWPWAVIDGNGHIVNRFKSEDDARKWIAGWGSGRVRHVPEAKAVDIF